MNTKEKPNITWDTTNRMEDRKWFIVKYIYLLVLGL